MKSEILSNAFNQALDKERQEVATCESIHRLQRGSAIYCLAFAPFGGLGAKKCKNKTKLPDPSNMKSGLLLCLLVLISTVAPAQLRLPRLISDGMVLQRDTPLKVWGWANTGEKITVRFTNRTYKTVAGPDGKWQVKMPPIPSGGPFTMDIAGTSRLQVKDILIGDVWFCSGQSNMVHQMNIHDVRYAKEIAEANDPQIRQFWVPTMTSLQGPQSDVPNGQ